MFTSHEGGVVGGEVFVAQGQVLGGAIPLDLDDHGVGVGGEGGFDVQLDGLCGANAYWKAVTAGELGGVVRVDDGCCGEDPSGASLW